MNRNEKYTRERIPSNLASNQSRRMQSLHSLSSTDRVFSSNRFDEFSQRIDNAIKQHNIIQQEIQSFKNPIINSKKATLNESPNHSYIIPNSNNQRNVMGTPSTSGVIKELKNLFQESENLLSNARNDSLYKFDNEIEKNVSLANNINNISNYYSNVSQNNNNFSSIKNEKFESAEILEIANQVLNKSNLDLKNYNKVLQIELNSYKSRLSKQRGPLTQFDTNMPILIDTLKTALNSSQMSSQELNDIYQKVREKNESLKLENQNLNEEITKYSNENKNTNTKGKDIKEINNNLAKKYNELIEENQEILTEIKTLNSQIEEQEIKNDNLTKIINNFHKDNEESQEAFLQLKNEMNNLKNHKEKIERNKEEADNLAKEGKEEIASRDEEINQLNEKVEKLYDEMNKLAEENQDLNKELISKKEANEKLDFSIAETRSNIEKMKENSASLKKCIGYINQTFSAMKESYRMFDKAAKEKSNFDENKMSNWNKKKQLFEILCNTFEKTIQMEEIEEKYKKIINEQNEKLNSLGK